MAAENLNDKLDTSDQLDAPDSTPKRKRRLIPFLFSFVTFVAIAGGVIYASQNWFGPEVDEELISGGIVTKKASETKADTDETDVDKEVKGLTAILTSHTIEKAKHPLRPALRLAREGMKKIDETVFDYEAVIEKQCRVGGSLGPVQHMLVRVRHEREVDGEKIPFSVYTKFISPKNVIGQEAIYVDGWNNNRICAHLKPGLLNIRRWNFNPTDALAMAGNLHPITKIGIRNLLKQILQKGNKELELEGLDPQEEYSITLDRNIEIDGRKCMMVEIKHNKDREEYEYHIARIYMDLEYEIPVAYEGYLWPEEGGEPLLLERYMYTRIKLNPGFGDETFDPENEEYNYPN